MAHQLKNVKVSRDEKAWELEVKAEIPAEVLNTYREEALKEMQRDAKLDGFRPGKAPIERIIQIYGEETILRHAAQHAIEHELPELLAGEKALVIEAPRVTTDVPQSGKALAFEARASLAPRVELPEYKKIAKKHLETTEDTSVSDAEHQEAMTHLRRERARIDKIEAGTDAQKAAEEAKALAEGDLPALDDQFVQSLGYESAEKFADVLRTNIKNEKEYRVQEKRRASILDDLVKEAKISYPAALLEYELDDMEARMKDDIAHMGMNFEAYLTQAKKTREEMRASWKESADKRARVRLILAEIARKENIEPDQKALDHEITHAKEHYPNANVEALRAHIVHAMRNEATLKFLEATPEK